MEKKYKKYVPFAITALVSAVVFFYAGMTYGQQSAANSRQQFIQSRSQRTGGGFQMAGGFVAGTVMSKDAQSITVKTRDGSSRIVIYSSSTPVVKPVSGSLSDVSVGSDVTVQGTQNSDGSVTAQSIQVGQARQNGQ